MTPQPNVDHGATFNEVVKLGILAWRYQISALSNQVTDVIRRNIASREWPLQASILDDIYDAVPSGTPLREVVRSALGQLPRPNAEGEVLKDEWKATFLKHAELGWDYIQAGATEWTLKDYLSGVCSFHDHQGVSHHGSFSPCDGCPYAQEDCYPDTAPDDVNRVNGLTNGEHRSDVIAEEVIPGPETPIIRTSDPESKESVATESTIGKDNGLQKGLSKTHNGAVLKEPTAEKVNGVQEEMIKTPNRTALEEPAVDKSNAVQEDLSKKPNGTALKEAAADKGNAVQEEPSKKLNGMALKEPETNKTVMLEDGVEDETNGAKEPDSLADIDRTTVTSDEVNGGGKDNESVLEDVDEKVEDKVEATAMDRTMSVGGTKASKSQKKKNRKSAGKA